MRFSFEGHRANNGELIRATLSAPDEAAAYRELTRRGIQTLALTPLGDDAPDSASHSNGLLVILSFLIPLAGFIVGAIFLSKSTPENQRTGRMCLLASVAGLVFGAVVAVAVMSSITT